MQVLMLLTAVTVLVLVCVTHLQSYMRMLIVEHDEMEKLNAV